MSENDAAATAAVDNQPDLDLDSPIEGEDTLGDPGKKALAALKDQVRTLKAELSTRMAAGGDEKAVLNLAQERKNAEKVRQELEELRAFKAKSEGTEAEYQLSLETQRIQQEALAAANARILKSELKALATGKLADPTDAALYVDLTKFSVSDDGEVDSDALTNAIADLLEKKPHLAAQKQSRFDGGADQGAKGKESAPTQWTKEDLEKASPEAIVQAQAAGQLKNILGY